MPYKLIYGAKNNYKQSKYYAKQYRFDFTFSSYQNWKPRYDI